MLNRDPFFTCICCTITGKWSEVDQKWNITLRFCLNHDVWWSQPFIFCASLISHQTKRRRSICRVENTQRFRLHLISVVFFSRCLTPTLPPFLSLKSSRWGRDAMPANDFFELQAFLKLQTPPTLPHPFPPIALSPYCFPPLARIHICIRPHTVFSFASICFYHVVWSEYWRTSLKKPAQPRFPACRADK